jgi:hypothetical protein
MVTGVSDAQHPEVLPALLRVRNRRRRPSSVLISTDRAMRPLRGFVAALFKSQLTANQIDADGLTPQ